jgi:hypothetical protein
MNAVLAREACAGAPYRQVVAARLGSALSVSETELLMLDSWFDTGSEDSAMLASGLSSRLAKLQRKADGDPVRLATKFIQVTIPLWRQLGALA